MSDIPVLDFSQNKKDLSQQVADTGHRLGGFYAVNHDISERTLAKAFEKSSAYFAQPHVEKMRLSAHDNALFRGYESAFENNDPGQALARESFFVGHERAWNEKTPFEGPNVWPEHDPEFRSVMYQQFLQMTELARSVTDLIETGLGIQAGSFAKLMDRQNCALRLVHYPPAGQREGIVPHTDWSCVSIVFQDEQGGLEFQAEDGRWHTAYHKPGTCVINFGKIMQRLTNDHIKATPHRVINKSGRDRYSICLFMDLNHDAVLKAFPEFVSHENPDKYAPVMQSEYLLEMHQDNYDHDGRTEKAGSRKKDGLIIR